MTSIPEHLQVLERHACYRPVGHVSFREALDLIVHAVTFCHDHGIGKLLVDTTGFTGLESPTIADRYALGTETAGAASGAVKIAVVVQPDLIDPNRFGVLVAANRGLAAAPFATEVAALEWLLGSESA